MSESPYLYPTDEFDPYNPNHIITLNLDADVYNEFFAHAINKNLSPQAWVKEQIGTVLTHIRTESNLIHIDEDGWLT